MNRLVPAITIVLVLGATARAAMFTPARPGQKLSENDTHLLQGAVVEALTQSKAGATASWSDDASGRAGQVTVLKLYARDTAPCATVQHVFTKGGGETYVLPFCRQADGSWKIQY
ncbi:MAG TPA: hypothetical protein VH019_06535 [Rhizomicrobium sp.]|jgi:surface antigen|nr:hypothetical protein [Rhizomicrobium sp.]